MRIYQKLIIVFFILGSLVALVSYITFSKAQEALQEQIGKEALLLTDQIMMEIDEEIYHRIEEMQAFAVDISLVNEARLSNEGFDRIADVQKYIKTIDRDWKDKKNTQIIRSILNNKLSRKLKKHLEFYKQIYGYNVFGEMYVTNKYGVAIAATVRLSDYLQADEEWYQEAIAVNDFWVDDLEYDESSDTFSIGIVNNLYDEEGNFVGIFKGALNTEDIKYAMDLIHSRSQYKSMKPYLVDRNGLTIFSGLDQSLKQEGRDVRLVEFGTDISLREPVAQVIKGNNGYILNIEGGKKLLSVFSRSNGFRGFKGLGWSLIIDFETDEIFSPVFKLKKGISLVFMVTMIVAALIIIFIFRSISRPIAKLRTASIEIGKGKLDTRVNFKSKDEVGLLAVTFNKMTEDLQKKDISLRESEEKYRRLIENLQDNYFFYVHDTEGIFTYISPSLTNILGYSAEEFLTHYSEYLTDNPINKEVIKNTELSTQGIKQPPYEVEIYHKDGTIRTLQVQEVPISDTNGNVIAVEGISQDITERKRAEEELDKYHGQLEELVEERTSELENVHVELVRKERLATLGQLIATVSHELRNPLGTIRNSVSSIGDAIGNNRMDLVNRALKRAESSIKRCNRIINELLDFTRKLEIKLERTEIDSWLNEVLDEQEFPEDIECVRELNSGIVLPIDRERMQRVVNNVVTNAVQAMQDENSEGNQLKVKSSVNGKRLELSFIDTGPGIPDEIREKIFEPLFSTRNFGIGLGMPIIKNIMEEHQGEVMFQSEVNKGTIVTLTLPIHKLKEKDEEAV